MHNSSDSCDGPFTDPANAKTCTLPSGARDNPGTFPKNAAMDRAIEARFGKPGDAFAGMKTSDTGNRFAGPGICD